MFLYICVLFSVFPSAVRVWLCILTWYWMLWGLIFPYWATGLRLFAKMWKSHKPTCGIHSRWDPDEQQTKILADQPPVLLEYPYPLISIFDLASAPDLRWYRKSVAVWCSEALWSQLRQKLPKYIISSFNFVQKPKNSILANVIKSVYYILSEVVSVSQSRTKGIQKSQFQYNWNLMCLCQLHNRLFGPSVSRFSIVIDFLTESTISA